MTTSGVDSSTVPQVANTGRVSARADAGVPIGGNVIAAWRSWWTWTPGNGTHNLQISWNVIGKNSTVFIIASEIDSHGTRFVAAAPIRVSSVAPGNGVVNFKIHIEWNKPIPMRTDVMVFN
ncbi:hypothetical protein [Streptomyces albireticuli]|uniref:hypothetical protein n=1 Tax=Streptomyces albireticuli TaxID=1940 RepID=UPI00117CEBC9|nr:hypothetical protein [Streptomyces albireticuli]MCD9146095.1 hypothetical protein [Streptomyces albireticuli]MCD9166281.1 hypothetical protein [Streptomyces albireticuli]MCD9196604.1 hypothetical protein [Streptomyces albireticuli]